MSYRRLLLGLALASQAATAVQARAQTLGGGQAPDISLVRVFLAFFFCVILAVAGAFALRFKVTGRFDWPKFAPPALRRLVLVERLRLGMHHELCLIAFEGHEFLVSVSPSGIERFEAVNEAGASGKP